MLADTGSSEWVRRSYLDRMQDLVIAEYGMLDEEVAARLRAALPRIPGGEEVMKRHAESFAPRKDPGEVQAPPEPGAGSKPTVDPRS